MPNASGVKRGYNYQDVVALYYFLDNIENISKINDEGEDDIEIIFEDGKYVFLQAKESVKSDKAITKPLLRKALSTLYEDFKNHKTDIKELGIITNSNFPFTKKDFNFLLPYQYYKYDALSRTAQNRIQEQIKILEANQASTVLDLKKLSVTKISYSGYDERSRLQQLNIVVNEFLEKAKIESRMTARLSDAWLISFNRSSEDAKDYITKRHFLSQTEIEVMDEPEFETFFREFDIQTGNKRFIKDQYEKFLRKCIEKFTIVSKIDNDYRKFSIENSDKGQNEIEIDFVNKESKIITKELGLQNMDADLDIAKLIVWLRITNDTYIENIEKAANVKN